MRPSHGQKQVIGIVNFLFNAPMEDSLKIDLFPVFQLNPAFSGKFYDNFIIF